MVLGVLVKREVKAFMKNPAFIFSLVLIVVMYSVVFGIMRAGVEQAVTEAGRISIGVVVANRTRLVDELLYLLNGTTGGRIKLYNSLGEAVEELGVGVVIPSNIEELVESGRVELRGSVKVYSVSLMSAQSRLLVLDTVRALIEQLLPVAYSRVYNVTLPPSTRVLVTSSVVYYEREFSSQGFVFISNIISALPMLIGIIIGTNAGYATQLVAFEKAEKAFEMLLSQPIKRSRVVLAKIIGASVASIIFAAAYFAGLLIPLVLLPPPQGSGNHLADVPAPVGAEVSGIDLVTGVVVPTVLSLVLGLFSSGSLGILLGSLVSDERTAGVLISPVVLIYMGLGFAIMFLGFELNYALSVISGVLVVALPSLYATSLLADKPIYALVGVGSAVLTCLVLVALTVVVFNRDIVVLGVRIKLKKSE